MSDKKSKTYVVMGSNAWGISTTLELAKRNWRREARPGARLDDGYGIYILDEDTEFEGVDMMGRLHYKGNKPEFTEVPARPRK